MSRLIVEKLGPAIEEGRVVLVPLQYEMGPGAVSITASEVLHLAADQKTRVAARVKKQPRGQCGSRGLAVRPGDDDGGLAGQEVFRDSLWHREDRQAPP